MTAGGRPQDHNAELPEQEAVRGNTQTTLCSCQGPDSGVSELPLPGELSGHLVWLASPPLTGDLG